MEKAPEYGYPDTGCGYYGKKLPYADWFKMNNGQRCQINFLEQITYTLVSSAIASVSYPSVSFYTLLVWFFGRFAFSLGYTILGPKGRMVGALTMDLTMLINLIVMLCSVGMMAKWI